MALAEGLNELTFRTREARTALWCALQLSSTDLPLICIRAAEMSAMRIKFLALKTASGTAAIDDAGETSDCEADDGINESDEKRLASAFIANSRCTSD